jgi:hypothetical protein
LLTDALIVSPQHAQQLQQEVVLDQQVFKAPPNQYSLTVPANITRGIAFNVIITALNSAGVVDTTYVPNGTVLTPTSSDPGDIVTPINIPDINWVAGQVTQAYTLTGGAGLDTLSFTAVETSVDYLGTSPDIGIGTSSVTIPANWWTAIWTGIGSYSGVDFDYPTAVQQAYAALQVAPRVVYTSFLGVAESFIIGGGDDWEYGGGDNGFATNGLRVTRYTITDPQKAGLMALKVQALLMGAVQILDYGGQYSTKMIEGAYQLHYSDVEPMTYADLLGTNLAGSGIAYGGKIGYIGSWGSLTYNYTPLAPDTLNNAFYASIPVAFLRTMVGNSLYLWLTHSTNQLDCGVGYAKSMPPHTATIYHGAGASRIALLEIQV